MGEASFSVGSRFFLTNCQSMQEMSAPESTSVEVLTTLRVCKGIINCMGICIDLFEVDTNTGAHITKEGEFCVKVNLPFKNPVERKLRLLLRLLHHLLSLLTPGVFLPCGPIGCKVSLGCQGRQSKWMPYVHFCSIGSKVPF